MVFNTRFEDKVGTNLEELLGAAHTEIILEVNLVSENIFYK